MLTTKTDRLIAEDAIEFGLHVRQGGWRLGLLVARSVTPAKAGRPVIGAPAPIKVSAREFAQKSGTSHDRVMRYLRAWDDAALDGIVPESELMVPGEELDGLDAEDLPEWSDYYDSNRVQASPEALERFTAAAEEAGTTTRTAVQVARNKKAVAAAIMADPEVEKVARDAVIKKEDQRDRERRRKIIDAGPKERPADGSLSRQEEDEADANFDSLVIKLRAMKRTGQEALGLALDIQGFQQKTKRAMVIDAVDELRTLLNAIQEAAEGRSMDDELAALLGG